MIYPFFRRVVCFGNGGLALRLSQQHNQKQQSVARNESFSFFLLSYNVVERKRKLLFLRNLLALIWPVMALKVTFNVANLCGNIVPKPIKTNVL